MRSLVVVLFPLLFLGFLFYGCCCGTWKFLGQGLNLSHNCDPSHSCSNAGSFNPLHQVRDQTYTSTVTWAAAVRFLTHCTTVGTPIIFFPWGRVTFCFIFVYLTILEYILNFLVLCYEYCGFSYILLKKFMREDCCLFCFLP